MENIPVTYIWCCGPGCWYFGVLVTRNLNSRDATDRGASIGMERGLQPFCCKKPQIQGPRGRKEVAKEGEDATLV